VRKIARRERQVLRHFHRSLFTWEWQVLAVPGSTVHHHKYPDIHLPVSGLPPEVTVQTGALPHRSVTRRPPHCLPLAARFRKRTPASGPECPTLGRSGNGHDATPRGPPRSAGVRSVVRIDHGSELEGHITMSFIIFRSTNAPFLRSKLGKLRKDYISRRQEKGPMEKHLRRQVLYHSPGQLRRDVPNDAAPKIVTRSFGSAPVRISVSIKPFASSTYRDPARNHAPTCSAWGRSGSALDRATRKPVTLLVLSAAISVS